MRFIVKHFAQPNYSEVIFSICQAVSQLRSKLDLISSQAALPMSEPRWRLDWKMEGLMEITNLQRLEDAHTSREEFAPNASE